MAFIRNNPVIQEQIRELGRHFFKIDAPKPEDRPASVKMTMGKGSIKADAPKLSR